MGGGVVGGGAIGTVSGPWLLGYAGARRLLDCSNAKTNVELPFRSGPQDFAWFVPVRAAIIGLVSEVGQVGLRDRVVGCRRAWLPTTPSC